MAQIPDATDSHKKGHGGEPYYTEKKLWQMLDAGKHHEKERAFVIIMVRLHNGAPFRETDPMERAYQALYDMGDRATIYMIRHFLSTAGIDLSPIHGLTELLGFRPIRIKEPESAPDPDPESEYDRMTEQELVAALSQPAPEPVAETPSAPPQQERRVSQKKRRKAEQAGKGFGRKAPRFIEEPVAAG